MHMPRDGNHQVLGCLVHAQQCQPRPRDLGQVPRKESMASSVLSDKEINITAKIIIVASKKSSLKEVRKECG